MQSVKRKMAVLLSMALQLCLISVSSAYGQDAQADTAFLQTSINNALAIYEEAIGVQTHLYNGTEYIDYKKVHFEGDQFLVSKAAVRGKVYYDGAWYRQVPMLYDLVTDELVVPHNSSGLMLKLITSKIDTFQLHGHTFVRLQADSVNPEMPQPGFYDLLHSGDTQFLVKRIKNMQDRATPAGMEGEFRVSDKLYIRKDGEYHQVSSKRSVYKLFKDKKKQLQKYASAQGLNFRKQKEEAILAVARYYDSLPAAEAEGKGN